MNDAQWPLQEAIVARLKADIATPIFDAVPDNQETDYIRIQNVTEEDVSGKNCPISLISFIFDCWSTYKGKKEVSAMMKAIGQSLTYSNSQVPNPLILTDFWVSYVSKTGSIILEVEDESFFQYQGILTVTFRVKEK
jgi:hypothetical protein